MSDKKLRRFLIRRNCEYSIEVDAETEEEAINEANSNPLDEWTQAWSPTEVEDDGPII